MAEPRWIPRRRKLAEGLEALTGPVLVGALTREGRVLLVNAAPDWALASVGIAPASVETLLLTHANRAVCEGAETLGAEILVPEGERELFERPERFWADDRHRLETYASFHPSPVTPRFGLPIARGLGDGEILKWRGVSIRAIGAPGPTEAGLSYLLDLEDGRVAFVGDLLCGHGRIRDLYSLQGSRRLPGGGSIGEYHAYCERAQDVLHSLERVLELGPDALVPSRGEIVTDPSGAVGALRANLEAVLAEYHSTTSARWYFAGGHPLWPADRAPLERRLRPLPAWVREIGGTSRAVVADTGEALLIDCAGDVPERVAGLQAEGKLGPVEVLWVTHFHFDHTDRVNDQRAREGSAVTLHETMADILARPDAYLLPCLHPRPIPADRITRDGETWEWRGFRITAMDFPGQTLYDAALLVERGAEAVLFVGDSLTPGGCDDYCPQNRNLLGEGLGLVRCLDLVGDLPEGCVLVNEHVDGAFAFTAAERAELRASLLRRRELCRALLPWDDPNYGLDPRWVSADPYFQQAAPGSEVAWTVRVRNHSAKPRRAQVRLRAPAGWSPLVEEARAEIAPGADGEIRLSARAPSHAAPGRAVVGFHLVYGGADLLEAAEAIVEFTE